MTTTRARLFLAPQLLGYSYGAGHPFQIDRLREVLRLCEALDLLPRDGSPAEPSPATRGEIERCHDAGYIDVLEDPGRLPAHRLAAHGLGHGDNPVFPGLWEACRLSAGGSLAAARWLLEGIRAGEARRAFHPGGGLHHAMRDRASGFCYVNDGVLAIQELADAGLRVCYIDVDAHHGDGVQEAFYEDPRVVTVSIHQDGRTIFPGTGFPNEIGRGAGAGCSVNVPILPGGSDEEYDRFREELVIPLVEAVHPDVLVTEIGVDSLGDDPLAQLEWTLSGLDRFLVWAGSTRLPWLALGGGGYRRWNVIRGWTLVWSRMLEQGLPDRRPAGDRAGALPDAWPWRLWEEPPPRGLTDPATRRRQMGQVLAFLQERILQRLDR